MRKSGKPKKRQSRIGNGGGHEKCNDVRAPYYWEKCPRPTEPFRITGRYGMDNGMRSFVYCMGDSNTVYRRGKLEGWQRKKFYVSPDWKQTTYDSKIALEYTLQLSGLDFTN